MALVRYAVMIKCIGPILRHFVLVTVQTNIRDMATRSICTCQRILAHINCRIGFNAFVTLHKRST